MDIATLAGFIVGNALLVVVMIMSGGLAMYWDLTSLIVVLGGAAGSVVMRWPLAHTIGSMTAMTKSVMNSVDDAQELITVVVDLAQTARKGSILALEKVEIKNKYLSRSVKYMVDGYDQEVINSILELEIKNLSKRHTNMIEVFENMGEACPAFGMIGTVIGLIVIMANLSDPSAIGPGLAVALVTTLYGSLIANIFFIPIAQKLKYRSKEERSNLNLIKEGVNSIIKGENPRSIQERLESFL